MPAVTVSDLSKLPAVPEVDRAQAAERPVKSVTTAPRGLEGEGFPVRRAFAGVHLEDLDPFVHMDQMGEVEYAPGEPKGTPWHPHRGFETVTYMIDGTFQHQDSHGGGGLITDGATQWMTAGRGILHIETPPEKLVVSGGTFHGIQLWVNLPARDKMISPAYQGLEADDVTLLSSWDGGALVRIIAGDVGEHRGPGSTHTPMAFMHASLAPGALLELPWNPGFNALVYLLAGSGRVGSEGRPVASGQLVDVRSRGLPVTAGRRHAGVQHQPPRGPDPRRPADRGARGALRPLRHEHQGRDRAGPRGLRGGPAGDDPAERPHAARVRSGPGAGGADRDLKRCGEPLRQPQRVAAVTP